MVAHKLRLMRPLTHACMPYTAHAAPGGLTGYEEQGSPDAAGDTRGTNMPGSELAPPAGCAGDPASRTSGDSEGRLRVVCGGCSFTLCADVGLASALSASGSRAGDPANWAGLAGWAAAKPLTPSLDGLLMGLVAPWRLLIGELAKASNMLLLGLSADVEPALWSC